MSIMNTYVLTILLLIFVSITAFSETDDQATKGYLNETASSNPSLLKESVSRGVDEGLDTKQPVDIPTLNKHIDRFNDKIEQANNRITNHQNNSSDAENDKKIALEEKTIAHIQAKILVQQRRINNLMNLMGQ